MPIVSLCKPNNSLIDVQQLVCNLCSSGVLEQLRHGTTSSLQVSVATNDVLVAADSRAEHSNSRPVIVQNIPVVFEFAAVFL
jgi:uridine phosphorylase